MKVDFISFVKVVNMDLSKIPLPFGATLVKQDTLNRFILSTRVSSSNGMNSGLYLYLDDIKLPKTQYNDSVYFYAKAICLAKIQVNTVMECAQKWESVASTKKDNLIAHIKDYTVTTLISTYSKKDGEEIRFNGYCKCGIRHNKSTVNDFKLWQNCKKRIISEMVIGKLLKVELIGDSSLAWSYATYDDLDFHECLVTDELTNFLDGKSLKDVFLDHLYIEENR